MLVLHGNWLLPTQPTESGRFLLWAETSQAKLRKPRGRPQVPPHPFAAPPEAVQQAILRLGPLPDTPAMVRFNLFLPADGNLPLPSPRLVHDWDELADATPTGLRRFKLEGLALDATDALRLLTALPAPEALPPHLACGDDLMFWSTVARFALELLAGQRYIPAIEQVDAQTFHARWRPVFDRPEDASRLAQLLRSMPPVARACLPPELKGEPQPPPAHYLLESFLISVVDSAVREWHGHAWRPLRGDDVAVAWLNALFAADPTIEGPYFTLSTLAKAHKAWVRQLQVAGDAAFRVCLRLEVPETTEKAWPLDFLLQASDDPSLLVPATTVWKARGKTLTYLNRRFEEPQERLLTALGYASRIFPPLERSLHQRRPTAAHLSTDEAYTFLRQAASLLEQSGFGLLVPPWWNRRGSRLGARLQVKSPSSSTDTSSGLLSMENLVNYQWEIVLGDQALTREEFEALVRLKTPLVQIRGQWVALNPEQIEAAIRFWEKRQAEAQMNVLDALSWGLSGEGEVDGLPVEKVEISGWFGELLERLKQGEQLEELPQPDSLAGELRPYQQRGFSWLTFMRRWGLGACLADDMGLGKTVETIALLLHDREHDGQVPPALVICPTSVAGNWQREIERFAPDLRSMLHHGTERASGQEFLDEVTKHDVVITSYGLARRDADLLAQVRWSAVILDEAQNIKNPAAKQTQAVRQLPADFRLALTGTPIENRLSELWSIMHFLNPGYLGSQKRFRGDYALPIERYRDPQATEQLRRLVGPFILRRLKTDPTIIQDLPEKLEMKVYCNLTPEQATLYEAVVQDSLTQIEESEGIQRKGIVLSTLLKLKQVCNHPAQFLGDGSELPGRSGKLARLSEMLEEVLAVGDRALIFTQFATMGEMLKRYLQEGFGREVLFLHGGTPRQQRERMIERFQGYGHGPPFFVLSLKAGGLGLNLTGANHVFHFDRWWNPAVENQATDRAFRIGQTRDVQVHKFLCIGTLEENIDALIESKKSLAESIVTADESWLTELSTDELREMLRLRPEAVGE
ncbi:MAG: DEAD/DEAH box helicase [Chloroflexi bacterium]|nr:DEAD/DEAH box helicase [Chloroflexota bacterium]